MKNIAIFASGSGTNAQAIAEYFKGNDIIIVDSIFSNNSLAGVHERAKKINIPSFSFTKNDFYDSKLLLKLLSDRHIDFIVLAGFMWLIPPYLVHEYPNRILNIHPALLPKYGGKGMYGMHVHNAVLANKEVESGITIHLVNEFYDKGDILFQARCKINESDTADTLANKIHELEHMHFPRIIENVILGKQEKF